MRSQYILNQLNFCDRFAYTVANVAMHNWPSYVWQRSHSPTCIRTCSCTSRVRRQDAGSSRSTSCSHHRSSNLGSWVTVWTCVRNTRMISWMLVMLMMMFEEAFRRETSPVTHRQGRVIGSSFQNQPLGLFPPRQHKSAVTILGHNASPFTVIFLHLSIMD